MSLTRYQKKGEQGESLQLVNLNAGLGMEGNRHQGGDKQLSLLIENIHDLHDSKKGLCHRRFKENILIEGLPALPLGTCFQLGEAIIRISDSHIHCYGECMLFSSDIQCNFPTSVAFAIVERSGVIHVGDDISPVTP